MAPPSGRDRRAVVDTVSAHAAAPSTGAGWRLPESGDERPEATVKALGFGAVQLANRVLPAALADPTQVQTAIVATKGGPQAAAVVQAHLDCARRRGRAHAAAPAGSGWAAMMSVDRSDRHPLIEEKVACPDRDAATKRITRKIIVSSLLLHALI